MRTGWLRGAAAITGAAAICACLVTFARASWALALGPGALRPADVLLALLSSAGSLLALWLTLGLVLAALSRVPGALGRSFAVVAERVTPAVARRLVALLLGTSIAAAVAPGTAVATSGAPHRHAVAAVVAASPVGAGDRVDLPSAASAERPRPPDPGFRPITRAAPPPASLHPLQTSPRPPSATADPYVVRRGDTLWDIAARALGPQASASAVAREWPRWYAANRAVIGPDPSLIRPGQRLQPPSTEDGSP